MKKNNFIYLVTLIPLFLVIFIFIMPKSSRKEDDIIYADASFYNNTITVNVEGEVLKKGSYVMYKNSTIKDLLDKCGTTDYTNIKGLSLNELLQDGGIYEISICEDSLKSVSITLKSPNIPVSDDNQSNNGNITLININTASLEELKSLDGIGDVKAKAIIDYRDKQKFNSKEELMNVTGISKEIYNANKDKITV